MITSRQYPRTRNLLLLGLLLSVLIHVLGGSLWPSFARRINAIMARVEPPHHEEVATSDVIRLERRVVPRPHVRTRVTPPHPQVQPQPVQRPIQPVAPKLPEPHVLRETPKQAAPKPDIAHITLRAPKQIAKSTGGSATAERAARESPSHNPRELSAEQIDRLEHQFSKVIADSRTDISTVQAATKVTPATMKHYAMSFNGMHGSLHAGEGYIYPTTRGQRIGNDIYYYAHYQYMYADGHVEEADIPWPYHFPINHDLFALGVRFIPEQGPPPNYKHTYKLPPLLEQFFTGIPADAGTG